MTPLEKKARDAARQKKYRARDRRVEHVEVCAPRECLYCKVVFQPTNRFGRYCNGNHKRMHIKRINEF